MIKRLLGNTGLEVPILSFGGSSLGSAFRAVHLDDAIQSVHTAYDLGLTYIDTSPYYGRGISEVLLGVALADIPRDRLILSSKLGRYDDDKFDFRAERVVESVEVSLHRLRTDYLDMVFCHDVEFVHLQQIIEVTLPALRRLQQQGKVRFIGVAGFPLRIFRTVLAQADIDVILSYCHYTLQNRSLKDLLPLLQQRGVGVVNASPFAMRLLTETGAPDWHPAPAPLRAACRQAAAFCRQQGCDIAKLALQFATLSGETPTCLAGSANPENIRKWVHWLEEPYEHELIAEVEKILQPVLNQSWPSGLPENND